jgi:hypothetical protein
MHSVVFIVASQTSVRIAAIVEWTSPFFFLSLPPSGRRPVDPLFLAFVYYVIHETDAGRGGRGVVSRA